MCYIHPLIMGTKPRSGSPPLRGWASAVDGGEVGGSCESPHHGEHDKASLQEFRLSNFSEILSLHIPLGINIESPLKEPPEQFIDLGDE